MFKRFSSGISSGQLVALMIFFSSDDGNFFIWERQTNIIREVLNGDKTIVNCVQPHPYICMLATSGIGQEVRLWSPQPEVCHQQFFSIWTLIRYNNYNFCCSFVSKKKKFKENFESKYRRNPFEDNIIQKNQQRMQSDPYDISGTTGEQPVICRTS